ncbi:hypothetical protein DFH08DRAFT_823424 [Mycena albidolilacea]|uniref:Uncharacterized protein n=1 Tax=Mycena albidolilacea TaxID=1033008 RepID=A0AAD7EBC7_9AGAR|nr:hypothetical protein DFH08DRAFT_823424 [Mycena albidolilacea]
MSGMQAGGVPHIQNTFGKLFLSGTCRRWNGIKTISTNGTKNPLRENFFARKKKHECANAAAGDPDEPSDKDNVGAIRWPPRLLEDASQYFAYEISEISAALLIARPAAIAIIMGTNSHPITSDYDEWMADAPELREAKHAERFAVRFQSAGILLGDASLAEVHAIHVFEVATASHRESTDDSPESLQLRANVPAAVLFHLVILRIYLRRSALDDLQIYFLARDFTSTELSISRTLLWCPNYPPHKWFKIKTVIRKAPAARIPASFLLAGHNVVGPRTIVAVIEPKGLKRKRVDDAKEEENGEEDRLALGFRFRLGMRRSARTRIVRNGD